MKIDKVIFSCSEEYSGFWNIQAKLFRLALGIEPICLLYGRKSHTTMTEEHGQVIEMEAVPDVPWSLQMVWSKFFLPLTEPEAVWMTGDIDLVPLQKHHFTATIADAPAGVIAHLNASGISRPRLGIDDGFLRMGCERLAKDRGQGSGGADLPAHYFVAQGKQFEIFTAGRTTAVDQARFIVESNRYGIGPMSGSTLKDAYSYYWCAEEHYTSELLQRALEEKRATLFPVYYNNGNNTQRINREWNGQDYVYNADLLARGQFVDIHCTRPFAMQEDALNRIVDLSGLLRA